MTRSPSGCLVLLAVAAACVEEPGDAGDPCDRAVEHVAACLEEEPAGQVSRCDAEEARRILSLDCAQLRDGKGDGWFAESLCWLGFTGEDCYGPPPPPTPSPAECRPLGGGASGYTGAGGVVFGRLLGPDGASAGSALLEFTPVHYDAGVVQTATDAGGRYTVRLSLQPHAVTVSWRGVCPTNTVYVYTDPTAFDWQITQRPDGTYLLERR